MCECLVWKVAKGAWDAGDVIVVVADGHPWTDTERGHPEWRIETFPGVTTAEFADMMVPDVRNGVLWRNRGRKLEDRQKITKPISGVIRL
jgi:hypothetical protein